MDDTIIKGVSVISISPVPMVSSGKVIGIGMQSIYQFHRAILKNSAHVNFIQIGNYEQDFVFKVEGVKTTVVKLRPILEGTKLERHINKLFNLLRFVVASVYTAKKIVKHNNQIGYKSVFVGHIANGVIAAFICSIIFRKPYIKRLYGTLLTFHMGYDKNYPVNLFKKIIMPIRHFEEWLAIKVPADGYALTNDGTYLDRISKFKKYDTKYHAINGLSTQILRSNKCYSINSKRIELFGEKKLVILTACRLTSWKRVDRVIEIARLLKKKVNNEILFCIYGEGELKQHFRTIVRDFHLEDIIQIRDGVEQHQIEEALNFADIYLSTQDYSNLTNTVLEAICIGKVVITLDVGGIRDVIKHNVNGLLVPLPNCEQRIANQIFNLIDNKVKMQSLSSGALHYSKENLISWEKRGELDAELLNYVVKTHTVFR